MILYGEVKIGLLLGYFLVTFVTFGLLLGYF